MEDIIIQIIEIVAVTLEMKVEDMKDLNRDESLRSYGLGSIKGMDLIILLEEKFEIEFDVDDFLIERIDTISKLKEIVEKYLKLKETREGE